MKRCGHCGQYLCRPWLRWEGTQVRGCLPGQRHLPLSPKAYQRYVDAELEALLT